MTTFLNISSPFSFTKVCLITELRHADDQRVDFGKKTDVSAKVFDRLVCQIEIPLEVKYELLELQHRRQLAEDGLRPRVAQVVRRHP